MATPLAALLVCSPKLGLSAPPDAQLLGGDYRLTVLFDGGEATWRAILDLKVNNRGQVEDGRIRYPSDSCSGAVADSVRRASDIKLTEKITKGSESCAPAHYTLSVRSKGLYTSPENIRARFGSVRFRLRSTEVRGRVIEAAYNPTPEAKYRLKTETRGWFRVREASDIETVRQYIANATNSVFYEDAQRKLYSFVRQKDTIGSYMRFLRRHPSAPDAQEAKDELMREVRAEGTWTSALRVKNAFDGTSIAERAQEYLLAKAQQDGSFDTLIRYLDCCTHKSRRVHNTIVNLVDTKGAITAEKVITEYLNCCRPDTRSAARRVHDILQLDAKIEWHTLNDVRSRFSRAGLRGTVDQRMLRLARQHSNVDRLISVARNAAGANIGIEAVRAIVEEGGAAELARAVTRHEDARKAFTRYLDRDIQTVEAERAGELAQAFAGCQECNGIPFLRHMSSVNDFGNDIASWTDLENLNNKPTYRAFFRVTGVAFSWRVTEKRRNSAQVALRLSPQRPLSEDHSVSVSVQATVECSKQGTEQYKNNETIWAMFIPVGTKTVLYRREYIKCHPSEEIKASMKAVDEKIGEGDVRADGTVMRDGWKYSVSKELRVVDKEANAIGRSLRDNDDEDEGRAASCRLVDVLRDEGVVSEAEVECDSEVVGAIDWIGTYGEIIGSDPSAPPDYQEYVGRCYTHSESSRRFSDGGVSKAVQWVARHCR